MQTYETLSIHDFDLSIRWFYCVQGIDTYCTSQVNLTAEKILIIITELSDDDVINI